MSRLVTPQGEILIPGVKEMIAPVTDDERQKIEAIHFEMKVGVGCGVWRFVESGVLRLL